MQLVKRIMQILLAGSIAFSLAACGNASTAKTETSMSSGAEGNEEKEISTNDALAGAETKTAVGASSEEKQSEEGKTLIAYFFVMETDGVDTVGGASRVAVDGEVLGNNEYVAKLIQQETGGDLFSIETVQDYPTTHAPLLEFAYNEKAKNARPELATKIKNLDQYDTIFLGYPNWNSDLPMPLYTFLESYDFSGKTVIPFSSHGGSGFSGTPSEIRRLEPGANVLNGYTTSRGSVAGDSENLRNWVQNLNLR